MTWKGENFCPHRDSNSESSVVQSVASQYTDCATPAPWKRRGRIIIIKADNKLKRRVKNRKIIS
jgi:hypothetical protein